MADDVSLEDYQRAGVRDASTVSRPEPGWIERYHVARPDGVSACGVVSLVGPWLPVVETEPARRCTRAGCRERWDGSGGHGRIGAYNRGCRCDPCVAANNRRHHGQVPRRYAAGEVPFEQIPHGHTGYNKYHCRCGVCCAAAAAIYTQRQAESRAAGWRWRDTWTGDELALAADASLTAAQVAALTGRTYAAVKSVRSKISRGDPVTLALLSHTQQRKA